MKRTISAALLVACAALATLAAQAPQAAKPETKAPAVAEASKPIPLADEDRQALVNAMSAVARAQWAVTVMQKEFDTAAAEAQRVYNRAAALHPDMTLNMQTGQYEPKKKDGGL